MPGGHHDKQHGALRGGALRGVRGGHVRDEERDADGVRGVRSGRQRVRVPAAAATTSQSVAAEETLLSPKNAIAPDFYTGCLGDLRPAAVGR